MAAGAGEVLSFDIPSVDRGEVLRYLGHAGQEVDPALEGRIDAGVERCIAVSRPAGVVRIFECAEAGEKDGRFVGRLEGTALELPGESMRAYLAGARAVGVLAVTLGMANERELRRLSLTSRVDELIFDAASSALVGLYGAPQERTRLSCKGCICHDFCLLRPTGRTCYGKRH